jgi:hypothetical protein
LENLDNGNLLVDLLSILPENVDCFIQAPSTSNKVILSMMIDSEFPYYKLVRLSQSNKDEFINELLNSSVGDEFHSYEIKQNNKLLFQGYDGVDFGVLSMTVVVPEWFKKKHMVMDDEMCMISNEW